MNDRIDDVRKFWDAQPCNIKHSSAQIGTIEYFEEVTKRKYFVEPHILRFANFRDWKGKTVLELGCGIGTDAVRFAINGAKYTGLDISPVSIELARKRFQLFGLKGNFIVGNIERISEVLEPQSFDLVYAFGSIHHTSNPSLVVDQVLNYLLPTSEFRLMLYARDSWKAIMIEAGLDQPEAQSGCPIARTFSKPEAQELLVKYDILSIEQDHLFPYVVEDYVQHRYVVQPWFRAMPEEMFRAIEKKLGWHLLIIAKLKDTLDKSPLRA